MSEPSLTFPGETLKEIPEEISNVALLSTACFIFNAITKINPLKIKKFWFAKEPVWIPGSKRLNDSSNGPPGLLYWPKHDRSIWCKQNCHTY